MMPAHLNCLIHTRPVGIIFHKKAVDAQQSCHFLCIRGRFFLIMIGQQIQKIFKQGGNRQYQRTVFGVGFEIIDDAVGFEEIFLNDGRL